MPWGHSERANLRKQLKMWDGQRERKKRELSCKRLWPAAWSTHRTKDVANTKGELAGCVQVPPPHRRQRGRRAQPEPEDKELQQSWPHRPASSPKLWAGSQLLTTSSWDICQEGHSSRSTPQRRRTAHLRQCVHRAPGHLRYSDLGSAQNAQPSLCPRRVPRNLSGKDLGGAWPAGSALGSTLAQHSGAWAV